MAPRGAWIIHRKLWPGVTKGRLGWTGVPSLVGDGSTADVGEGSISLPLHMFDTVKDLLVVFGVFGIGWGVGRITAEIKFHRSCVELGEHLERIANAYHPSEGTSNMLRKLAKGLKGE